MKLFTSQKDFEELHKIVDGARKNSSTIKLTRGQVLNLLMDHSQLWDKVKELGVEVDDTGTTTNTKGSNSEGSEQNPAVIPE